MKYLFQTLAPLFMSTRVYIPINYECSTDEDSTVGCSVTLGVHTRMLGLHTSMNQ